MNKIIAFVWITLLSGVARSADWAVSPQDIATIDSNSRENADSGTRVDALSAGFVGEGTGTCAAPQAFLGDGTGTCAAPNAFVGDGTGTCAAPETFQGRLDSLSDRSLREIKGIVGQTRSEAERRMVLEKVFEIIGTEKQ